MNEIGISAATQDEAAAILSLLESSELPTRDSWITLRPLLLPDAEQQLWAALP